MRWWCISVLVVVGTMAGVEGKPNPEPLSNQQQLRRRGVSRGRTNTMVEQETPVQVETTEPVLEYAATQQNLVEREKQLQSYEALLKTREEELEKIKEAFEQRERVLEEREYTLDIRDTELDQRGKNIDKQILETDKRLKEREGRIQKREKMLGERESEILRLAEAREQEIDRLSKEREASAELREKALEDRERAIEERELKVEEREARLVKRMEANRKRFQRRRELKQLDQRIGRAFQHEKGETGSASSDVATFAKSSNLLRRPILEQVTFRQVVTTAPVSEPATSIIISSSSSSSSDDDVTTTDKQTQVTEAVAYENQKEQNQYSTQTSVSNAKGDSGQEAILQSTPVEQNSVGTTGVEGSLKKRRRGKGRQRQRRQHGHEHHRKHKVRKVVKKMASDGTMVVLSDE